MTPGPVLQTFINHARQEIKPNDALHSIFAYEKEMLQRLVRAIDTQNDTELAATVAQIKLELDMLRCSVFTVLPALVNMLSDELRRHA